MDNLMAKQLGDTYTVGIVTEGCFVFPHQGIRHDTTVFAVRDVPDGFFEDKASTTAPSGFSWYNNHKSRLTGEFRHVVVVKDPMLIGNIVFWG